MLEEVKAGLKSISVSLKADAVEEDIDADRDFAATGSITVEEISACHDDTIIGLHTTATSKCATELSGNDVGVLTVVPTSATPPTPSTAIQVVAGLGEATPSVQVKVQQGGAHEVFDEMPKRSSTIVDTVTDSLDPLMPARHSMLGPHQVLCVIQLEIVIPTKCSMECRRMGTCGINITNLVARMSEAKCNYHLAPALEELTVWPPPQLTSVAPMILRQPRPPDASCDSRRPPPLPWQPIIEVKSTCNGVELQWPPAILFMTAPWDPGGMINHNDCSVPVQLLDSSFIVQWVSAATNIIYSVQGTWCSTCCLTSEGDTIGLPIAGHHLSQWLNCRTFSNHYSVVLSVPMKWQCCESCRLWLIAWHGQVRGNKPCHFGLTNLRSSKSSNLEDWLAERQLQTGLLQQQLLCVQQKMESQANKHKSHKILHRVGRAGYKLQLLASSIIHPVVHVSMLKGHIPPSVKVLVDVSVLTAITDVALLWSPKSVKEKVRLSTVFRCSGHVFHGLWQPGNGSMNCMDVVLPAHLGVKLLPKVRVMSRFLLLCWP